MPNAKNDTGTNTTTRGDGLVWIRMCSSGQDHPALILKQASADNDNQLLVKWSSNNAEEWLDADEVTVYTELPSKRRCVEQKEAQQQQQNQKQPRKGKQQPVGKKKKPTQNIATTAKDKANQDRPTAPKRRMEKIQKEQHEKVAKRGTKDEQEKCAAKRKTKDKNCNGKATDKQADAPETTQDHSKSSSDSSYADSPNEIVQHKDGEGKEESKGGGVNLPKKSNNDNDNKEKQDENADNDENVHAEEKSHKSNDQHDSSDENDDDDDDAVMMDPPPGKRQRQTHADAADDSDEDDDDDDDDDNDFEFLDNDKDRNEEYSDDSDFPQFSPRQRRAQQQPQMTQEESEESESESEAEHDRRNAKKKARRHREDSEDDEEPDGASTPRTASKYQTGSKIQVFLGRHGWVPGEVIQCRTGDARALAGEYRIRVELDLDGCQLIGGNPET